ncbi:zinc finger protein 395b isoform X2 [Paramormyrops kingsleyae]|uniref:zinc finger protein 395b isoform X2 n=1 Tax=Paramormyrops kingsleyae TaxID=1676925 RepID=UPI000CD62F25|nr:zinc finger protein 395 isoform X2 [Paramormyrops kingsleyae]
MDWSGIPSRVSLGFLGFLGSTSGSPRPGAGSARPPVTPRAVRYPGAHLGKMSAVPKTRLGKRSPFGALVCAPCPLAEEGRCGPDAAGLGFQGSGLVRMPLDQLPGQVAPVGMEAYWNMSAPLPQTLPPTWPVSSSIDVPRRSPISVDMDKMMAAMVLTSLSCGPIVQSPPPRDPEPGEGCHSSPVHQGALCEHESAGGELSDSGSSGYWSLGRGHGSPAPSPCPADMATGTAPPPEDSLDLEQELFGEPAPRKRKNSLKAAYRCLWPSCCKVLSSVVGAKRHVRVVHLGSDSERSRREEDFYYTEIRAQPDPSAPLASVSAACASWPSCSSPASPTLPLVPELPAALPGPLSQSAPGCFWQIHSKQQYQACAPVQETASPSSTSPCSWIPSLSPTQSRKAAPFRCRSVSVGELWLPQHSAPSRPHHTSAFPLRGHGTSRRVRGEAKKCRKMYGIERRDQWCTACRWKKACQRFLD